MILKDISFSSPQENISFDETLFQMADKNGTEEYLRFWESPVYFIVLGRTAKAEDDIHLSTAQEDGIPVLRRASGGGTVVQGRGCLNYTLILSKQNHPVLNDLHASYAWISAKVIEALGPLGVEAVFRPTSDMALASTEKKFSGNAQRRGRTHLLHHGTILYDFDLDLITRYLKMPKDIPVYRNFRTHKDFVANIPIDPVQFKSALARGFGIKEII
ncbi:MAG: lipoate--protein ligase family protein [Candidatus Omnitrophica bacterium]|nr:lipoate--protein ligase family protein [Candidatus Omnitrophota bacterium]